MRDEERTSTVTPNRIGTVEVSGNAALSYCRYVSMHALACVQQRVCSSETCSARLVLYLSLPCLYNTTRELSKFGAVLHSQLGVMALQLLFSACTYVSQQ